MKLCDVYFEMAAKFLGRSNLAIALLLCCGGLICCSELSATPFYIGAQKEKKNQLKPVSAKKALQKPNALWFLDCASYKDEELIFLRSKKVVSHGKSAFQKYAIVDTKSWGRVLFMDGESQSAESDEYLYHESFVHPAMVAHPNPKTVLVIGAGEGAAAREILKHPSVERVVLVDIDGEVIRAVKKYLTSWHQGSFDNPKVQLLIQDGKKYVQTTNEKFDVVYIDVCDKLEKAGPVTELYTPAFDNAVKKILTPSGIVAVQAMELQQTAGSSDLGNVSKNLKQVFPHVHTYGMFIPSFYSTWGFVVATQTPVVATLTPEKIDDILSQRNLSSKLRHYDGLTHQHMFTLPKTVRNTLEH